jgi:CMP-N-acetylneuraminic acid synthetase
MLPCASCGCCAQAADVRTLGLVPARGGSGRVPRKNLARIAGITLVRRALETALAAGCFEVVALSSDDDEILSEADGLDVVTLRRPPELATDTALAKEVVLHALRALDDPADPFGVVTIIQCTSPFTAPEDLAGTVALLETTGAEAAVSVVRLDAVHHPLKLKRLEGDRLLPYLDDDRLTPSHELPPLWVRNGSAYAFRRDVVERGLDAEDVRGYEMPAERSLDIDTTRDLAFAEFLLERGGYSGRR